VWQVADWTLPLPKKRNRFMPKKEEGEKNPMKKRNKKLELGNW